MTGEERVLEDAVKLLRTLKARMEHQRRFGSTMPNNAERVLVQCEGDIEEWLKDHEDDLPRPEHVTNKPSGRHVPEAAYDVRKYYGSDAVERINKTARETSDMRDSEVKPLDETTPYEILASEVDWTYTPEQIKEAADSLGIPEDRVTERKSQYDIFEKLEGEL